MKHRGSTIEYAEDRTLDLVRAMRQCAASARPLAAAELFEKVVNTPAERFWVSPRRAAIVVSRIEAGKPLRGMRDNKLEMFREIHSRYLALRDKRKGQTLYQIVEAVVYQPAPRFYLTVDSAKHLLYKYLREKRKARTECATRKREALNE